MTKYKANSYYLIFRILSLLTILFLIGFFVFQENTPIKTVYGGIFLGLLILFFIIRLSRKLLVVRFKEETLQITYLISRKIRIISYSDVISLVCYDSRRGYHVVVIEFKYDEFKNPKKIKVDRFVDADKLVPFLKWLKAKNQIIHLDIRPSDSKLLPEFNKEFKKI